MISVEYQDNIYKIIDRLESLGNYYNNWASNALDAGYIQSAEIYAAQASAFFQAGWIVEDIMYNVMNSLKDTECSEGDLDE